ncbi:alpha/beta hydrolase [Oculatella sp. LEGE 06141]|nr:alpha/beta hydrolase [Oculatella sp. LEGE 06141]MBE9182024.1 alpha/beta hydrolase [Oculatella sp. LEGE 06141]
MPILLIFLWSGVGLFLSAWIIVPAPTSTLLPLGVGAPEVSPWLTVMNAVALLLLLLLSRRRQGTIYLCLMGNLVGLFISLLPLSQLPATQQRAAIAMQQALGEDYLTHVPQSVQAQMRPQPFGWIDALRGIAPAAVRHTSNLTFAHPDGVPLTLEIYQPPQVGQYPAIVVIYGGAWRSGSPSANPEFNRYMAARGYVVWAIDYRHAPRYRFPAQLNDVQTALQFIRQHAAEYETDVNRIALLGRSAGAHLAMLAAYQPEALPIRAVVNYYGPVDLAGGYADPPQPDPLDVRAVLRSFLGGTPDEMPQRYAQASPYTYVAPSLPPTLLIYGDRDHIVQSKFGRRMYESLKAAGNTAVWINIPWANHAFDAVFNGLSNQFALFHTERFLASILQRSPNAVDILSSQYNDSEWCLTGLKQVKGYA